MPFQLHPQLAADSFGIGDFPICRLLMMNDLQYPWFILVPRRDNIREVYELSDLDQMQVWRESAQLGRALMEAFRGDKLNVAALGNVVPQLHIHHVVRKSGDAAWPAPVWGRHPAQAMNPAQRNERLELIKPFLGRGFSAPKA